MGAPGLRPREGTLLLQGGQESLRSGAGSPRPRLTEHGAETRPKWNLASPGIQEKLIPLKNHRKEHKWWQFNAHDSELPELLQDTQMPTVQFRGADALLEPTEEWGGKGGIKLLPTQPVTCKWELAGGSPICLNFPTPSWAV